MFGFCAKNKFFFFFFSWLLWNVNRKSQAAARLSIPMTFSGPDPGFKVKSNITKTVRIRDKVTIAHEYETMPNISNGTMFGDFDRPLNASADILVCCTIGIIGS